MLQIRSSIVLATLGATGVLGGCELVAGIDGNLTVTDGGSSDRSIGSTSGGEDVGASSGDDAGTSGSSSSNSSSGSSTGSSGASTTSSSSSSGGASSSSSSSSGITSSSSSGSTTGSGGGPDGGYTCAGACAPLPLIVSTNFEPYGYEGDANTKLEGGASSVVQTASSSTKCSDGTARPAGAVGSCFAVTYTPVSPSSWAAIQWQHPNGNWGTAAGLPVAQGATKVTFYAKAAVAGLLLTVSAGGVNQNLSAGSFGDTFSASNPSVVLSTTWTQYTIDASDGFPPTSQGYGPVLGGFLWECTAQGSTAPIQFWIDSIEWTQ